MGQIQIHSSRSGDTGVPVLHNRAAEDLFGPFVEGMPVADWLQHVEARTADGRPLKPRDVSLLRAISGEQVRDSETFLRFDGGKWRCFRVHASPVAGPGPVAGIVALHETTTERTTARLNQCELRLSRLLS